ncbi:hypothetical protein EST38_g12462 [Candolleomyces aberdarensis]|uniref:Uncharacterized protein n=1 Tax=Candolleomyces aberdarensis TaxID=2316362 RepID=A0A4Q2D3H5_9AGAR|nr:hypothetical protein EST38_g12462 [Candolleomyces aberdarensis]
MPRATALDSPYEGLSIGASTWDWEDHAEHVAYLVKDIETAAMGKEKNLSRFFGITKYTLKARFFNHIIGPFMDLERVFRAGLKMPNHTGSAFTEEERKAYKSIEKQIPCLTQTMEELVKAGASHFVKLVNWMDEAMRKARSDDFARINAIVAEAGVANPKRDGGIKGITSATPKTARGFNHPEFARLLCPMKCVEEFDADPNLFMQKVQRGEIKILANDLPVFCYPFGHKYNPNDIEDGLCRSELLQRIMNGTLTGPSTTYGDDRASKNQSVAFKHGYTDVVPEDIAYHLTGLRNSLSEATSFGHKHKTFNNVKFYQHFVSLLTDGDHRSQQTLKFITDSIPNLRRGPKSLMTGLKRADSGGEDPIALIRKQRQQKESALEARQALQDRDPTPSNDDMEDDDDMYMDSPNEIVTTSRSDPPPSHRSSYSRPQVRQHQARSQPTPQPRSPALQDRTNNLSSSPLRGSREQSVESQNDEDDGDPMALFEKAVEDMLSEREDSVERAIFNEFVRVGEGSVGESVVKRATQLAKAYMNKHEHISIVETAQKTVRALLKMRERNAASVASTSQPPPRLVPATWSPTSTWSPATTKTATKTVPAKRPAESSASSASTVFKAPALRRDAENRVQERTPSAKRQKQHDPPSVSASFSMGGSQSRPRRSCSSKYSK